MRETDERQPNVKERQKEPQIEDRDLDSDSFSSVVQYLYNFEEVAYLVYKLYQLIERKFKLKHRTGDLRRFVQKWKSKRSIVSQSGHKMKFILDIEKIRKDAGTAVSAAQAKSCAVKERWKCLLNNLGTASDPGSDEDELGGWVWG